jgi:3-deoxy-D-manno-octulosonic-acid transferase
MVKVYHAELSGDTRFDRVIALGREIVKLPIIEAFGDKTRLVVAGSTWPADEELLLQVMNQAEVDFKLVIAPHEVHEEHIRQVMDKFVTYEPARYSAVNEDDIHNSKVLIIDSIGLLGSVYSYAYLSYVGGGFGAGIHNTLEAAAHNIPVVFGPNYQRFQEAVELERLGGGFCIHDVESCKRVFEILINDMLKYRQASVIAGEYVLDHAGATNRVIDKAREFIVGE